MILETIVRLGEWAHRAIVRGCLLCILLIVVTQFGGCGAPVLVTVGSTPMRPPIAGPDHSLFTRSLERDLDSSGKIIFRALEFDTLLTEYLQQIAVTKLDAFISRQAELAFWINAHNACFLDLYRRNRPLRGNFDASSVRSVHVLVIGGEKYSLEQIEESVIATRFHDPRAFFALDYGGRSAPRLLNEAYVEARLDGQLTHATTGFIMDPTKNRLDPRTRTFFASSIFSWRSSELAKASGTLGAFLRAFATGKVAEFFTAHANPHIEFVPYDWTQ